MAGNKGENKKELIRKRKYDIDLGMAASLLLLVFRIPLANILGNEGNGYLALTWELLLFAAVFFGHSLYAVIKDMVRRRIQKNQYHNSIRVLSTGMIFGGGLSLSGGILLFGCSDFLFHQIYGVKEAALSLKIFAFYLIFSTVSGCIRGYFEGMGSMMPTYFSKIIESLIAGIGILIFSSVFLNYGSKVADLLFNQQFKPGFGTAGTVCALLIGAVISLLFLGIIYRIYQIPLKDLLKRDETKVFEKRSNLIREMLKSSIIVILPVLFFKSYRIVNFTIYLKGYESENILQGLRYIGTYYGKSVLLVFICITLLLGSAKNKINRIKKTYLNRKLKLSRKYYIEEIKRLVIFSVPIAVIVGVGAEYLLKFFFHSAQKYEIVMLRIAVINIVIITIANYGYFILASLNRNIEVAIIFAISFVLQTFAIFILEKTSFMAYSIVIAELVFWITALIFNSLYLFKLLEFKTGRNNYIKYSSVE